MSKFKVSLKIEGFSLDIEGSREDATLISRNIGDQLSAVLAPAGVIVGGNVRTNTGYPVQIDAIPSNGSGQKKGRRKQSSTASGSENGSAIDFPILPRNLGIQSKIGKLQTSPFG